MTPENPSAEALTQLAAVPAPRPAFVPTAPPLPAQDIDDDELAAFLDVTAARRAEAEAVLAEAQRHFDIANQEAEHALTEEQKRRDREEEDRVNQLRAAFPGYTDGIDQSRRAFYAAFDEDELDLEKITQLWVQWQRFIGLAGRTRQQILVYDSQRSSEAFELWNQRIAAWSLLIRSVLSWKHGGIPANQQDDMAGLAAVNDRINKESQDAPRSLNRDAADQSTPFIEDLGLRDPTAASNDQIFGEKYDVYPSFDQTFSNAVAQAAVAHAQRTIPGKKIY